MGNTGKLEQEATCSSSEEESEDDPTTSGEDEDDDDDEEMDDSSSEDYSDSDDDDESLGAEIRQAELEGKLAVARFAGALGIPMRRRRSMPNVLMMLDVGQEEQQDATAVVTQPEHQQSMVAFMERMKNSQGYFQDPNLNRNNGTVVVVGTPRARSASQLEDLKKNTNSKDPTSPHMVFTKMMKDVKAPAPQDPFWMYYFLPVTAERTNAYTAPVISAARNLDISKLRLILQKEGPHSMEACNKQGETLVHLACRRRSSELLQFLVQEAKVSIRVRDDWHKTALHELCWNSQPCVPAQFDSFRFFLEQAPELLFTKDRRGFSPLQYVPKDSWANWCCFLEQEKQTLLSMVDRLRFRAS